MKIEDGRTSGAESNKTIDPNAAEDEKIYLDQFGAITSKLLQLEHAA